MLILREKRIKHPKQISNDLLSLQEELFVIESEIFFLFKNTEMHIILNGSFALTCKECEISKLHSISKLM
jgi:hypothetical protein